ncbi:hypothetical protein AB1N83_005953 [Pleurotus pulmonarius]
MRPRKVSILQLHLPLGNPTHGVSSSTKSTRLNRHSQDASLEVFSRISIYIYGYEGWTKVFLFSPWYYWSRLSRNPNMPTFNPSMFPDIGFSESQGAVVLPSFAWQSIQRTTTTTLASVSVVTSIEATTVLQTSSLPAPTTQTVSSLPPTALQSERPAQGTSKETSIGLGVGLGLVLLVALSYITYRYRLLAKLKIGPKPTVEVEPYNPSSSREVSELDDAQLLSRGKTRTFFRPNIRLGGGMWPANRSPDAMHDSDSIKSLPSYHSRI